MSEKYSEQLIENVEKVLEGFKYNDKSSQHDKKDVIKFRYEAAKFYNTLNDERKRNAKWLLYDILRDLPFLK